MSRTLRRAATAMLLVAVVAPVGAAGVDKADVAALKDALEKRGVTARIDLPIRKGMEVDPGGRIDMAVYHEKLDDFPVSIRKGERALLRTIVVEKDAIRVVLNNGGMGKMQHQGHLRWIEPGYYNQMGTTVVISFGRRLTADDLDPDLVVRALRDVVTIDGYAARDPSATAPAARQPAAPSAVAATVRLLAVEVMPSRVRRGEPVDLVVRFEVSGSGVGGTRVVESRQVYLGDDALFGDPRQRDGEWSDGVHSSAFELVVPESASAGYYRFVGGIVVDGTTHSREAIFEVLAR